MYCCKMVRQSIELRLVGDEVEMSRDTAVARIVAEGCARSPDAICCTSVASYL